MGFLFNWYHSEDSYETYLEDLTDHLSKLAGETILVKDIIAEEYYDNFEYNLLFEFRGNDYKILHWRNDDEQFLDELAIIKSEEGYGEE